MKAIKFPEVNVTIAKDQPQYTTLPTYIDNKTGMVVNCFQLDDLEVEQILAYKKIWIHHFTVGRMLQPFNMVAVNDYFSSVLHQDGRFTIQEQEPRVETEVEALLNGNNITTPIQSLYIHMYKKHKVNLSDEDLLEIVEISKEI